MCKQVLVIFIVSWSLVVAMPQGPDDRVGLERPSTSPVPEISDCNLDSIIGDVFGTGGGGDCNNNNPSPTPQVPPKTGGNGNGDSNGGYQPISEPPPRNNGDGYQPNSPNTYQDCEGGQCVPFYLCSDNNTIIEDGAGVIDIRLKDECGSYDLKCCGSTHIANGPVVEVKPQPTLNKCGVRHLDGVGVRITGAEDNESQYGEFPWMVAVVQPHPTRVQDGKPVNIYQCGGSLIHPQVVLTGAHCVRGKNNLVARMGEWDTQTMNELFPTQDRLVQEVIIHEQFNNNSLANDPALLILGSPVDMNVDNVGLLCLPQQNEIMDGRDCVASGWGKDKFGKKGNYQVILKKVEMPIVSRNPCLDALRKTRLGMHFKLHESFICAGGQPGKDTCKGDGGGPLACPSKSDPQVYVQAGIVAWGIECGTGTPGVYVNVPYFVSWINNKLQQRGIYLEGSCRTSNCGNSNSNSEYNPNSGGNIPPNTNNSSNNYNPQPGYSQNGGKYSPPKNNNDENYGTSLENENFYQGYNQSQSKNSSQNTKHPTNSHSNGDGYNISPGNHNNDLSTPSSNNDYNNGGSKPPMVGQSESTSSKYNSSNAKHCECVPFFLCGDNDTMAEDGVGLLDLRTKDECGAYDQKCCPKMYIRPSGVPSPSKVPAKKCGTRYTDGVGVRITGAEDNESQYGEFPWMVAVVQPHPTRVQDGKPVNIYQCGGSLIHPQVVLTGAHCVRGNENLVARMGEWDTQTMNELFPTQDRLVQEVIIHEQFNNNSLANDPALLILGSPVDMNVDNVGLLCLPQQNEIMDGRDCVASGWGKDKFGKEGNYQVILKSVELPIVPRSACLEALRQTRLGKHFKLDESFICAGGKPGEDTCKGDGGGPLACPSKSDPQVYVQAGIVAWGINCGTGTPGVYVNVPYFVSWINNKLQQRGISL